MVSPKIGHLLSSDLSVDAFSIKTSDPHEEFCKIFSIFRGLPLRLDAENWQFFRSVFLELGNFEVYHSIIQHFEGELTIGNAVARLRESVLSGFPCEHLISFVASNFFALDFSVTQTLPISILPPILSHPSLQIQSENSLYAFISSHLEHCPESFSLLEYVRFDFLTQDRICDFIRWSCDCFDFFNRSVWDSVCCRLKLQVSPIEKSSHFFNRFIEEHKPLSITGCSRSIALLQFLGSTSQTNTLFNSHTFRTLQYHFVGY
jgi:hypothetical protein